MFARYSLQTRARCVLNAPAVLLSNVGGGYNSSTGVGRRKKTSSPRIDGVIDTLRSPASVPAGDPKNSNNVIEVEHASVQPDVGLGEGRGRQQRKSKSPIKRSSSTTLKATQDERKLIISEGVTPAVNTSDVAGYKTSKGSSDAMERQHEYSVSSPESASSKVHPYVRRELPLSPLMDPDFLAAQRRYRTPKPYPGIERTLLQRQLERNPYAQALLTPVRQCSFLQIVLPSYFLQDFELLARPKTEEFWYLPRSLTVPFQRQEPSVRATLANGSVPTDHAAMQGGKKDSKPYTGASSTAAPKSYIIARYPLLAALNENRLLSDRWRRTFRRGSASASHTVDFRRTRLRTDTHDFILKLLRRRIIEGLVSFENPDATKFNHAYWSRCHGEQNVWEQVKKKKQISSILWLGSHNIPYKKANSNEQAKFENSKGEYDGQEGNTKGESASETVPLPGQDEPGEFATLDMNRKVPVHNLNYLLGEQGVKYLQSRSKQFRDVEAVVLKDKKATADVQMRLWKLQGYLAQHEWALTSVRHQESGEHGLKEKNKTKKMMISMSSRK